MLRYLLVFIVSFQPSITDQFSERVLGLSIINLQSAIYNDLAGVFHRLAPLFQHLAIPDESRTRVSGKFKVLCKFET